MSIPITCIVQELTEHKYKSEALIHELTSKLRSTEEVSPLMRYDMVEKFVKPYVPINFYACT